MESVKRYNSEQAVKCDAELCPCNPIKGEVCIDCGHDDLAHLPSGECSYKGGFSYCHCQKYNPLNALKHIASDYDRLVEVVRELIESPGREPCTCDWKPLDKKCYWCAVKENIITLIGEGGEEA